jgi:putative FmdB family regulatory protein
MPLYEYYCTSCQGVFETLRPAKEADAPVKCPACQHASSQRILSLFADTVKSSGGVSVQGMSSEMSHGFGGGCCGGACGCHN